MKKGYVWLRCALTLHLALAYLVFPLHVKMYWHSWNNDFPLWWECSDLMGKELCLWIWGGGCSYVELLKMKYARVPHLSFILLFLLVAGHGPSFIFHMTAFLITSEPLGPPCG